MSAAPAIPAFHLWGVKRVSKTDVGKAAYVLNGEQLAALTAAGVPPQQGTAFKVNVLFDPAISQVDASYYHSTRLDPKRSVEPRMGRDFITSWLKLGDEVVIGNIGSDVYAYKVSPTAPAPTPGSAALVATGTAPPPAAPGTTVPSSLLGGANAASSPAIGASVPVTPASAPLSATGPSATPAPAANASSTPASAPTVAEEAEHILSTESATQILNKARQATGAPLKRTVQREDFNRNPHVVAYALHRAQGSCEMPGCTLPLIEKADGSRYLEVHHIDSLGQGGDDTLVNVAALCPHCHRALHYSKDRDDLRNALRAYVANLPH